MIWRPKPGQRVRLRYAKRYARIMPCHDRTGAVLAAASGPGPVNALVKLDGGEAVVVPRGNLFLEAEA